MRGRMFPGAVAGRCARFTLSCLAEPPRAGCAGRQFQVSCSKFQVEAGRRGIERPPARSRGRCARFTLSCLAEPPRAGFARKFCVSQFKSRSAGHRPVFPSATLLHRATPPKAGAERVPSGGRAKLRIAESAPQTPRRRARTTRARAEKKTARHQNFFYCLPSRHLPQFRPTPAPAFVRIFPTQACKCRKRVSLFTATRF